MVPFLRLRTMAGMVWVCPKSGERISVVECRFPGARLRERARHAGREPTLSSHRHEAGAGESAGSVGNVANDDNRWAMNGNSARVVNRLPPLPIASKNEPFIAPHPSLEGR